MSRPQHLKNATIWNGESYTTRDLYVKDGRIIDAPAHNALKVDLAGYTLFPGLVNAHDHLELNHYPRTKFRDVYNNAHQWGEDVNARLNDEPFKTLRAYPLWDKVFIGGLKNLLCGATTVIHHGAPHKPMFHRDFPVRVLQKYGWAHSLHFNTEAEIVQSYRNTPENIPWFIHLAEGTDSVAASEYKRLKELGCVGKNTVIVHGIGLSDEDEQDGNRHRANYVLCPTTNEYLLGKTLHPGSHVHASLGLGSDSRLTAQGDLLDELRRYYELYHQIFHWMHPVMFFSKVSYFPKSRFIDKPGKVFAGNQPYTGETADFILLKMDYDSTYPMPLIHARRRDLDCVIYDGIPRIGNPELMAKFPHIQTVACLLDGVEKRIHIDLAKQIHRCKLKESGLEVDALPQNRFWLFWR